MSSRRPPIPRTLATRPQAGTGHAPQPARHDAARLVRHTLIDFSSLPLPADVRLALAQAFSFNTDGSLSGDSAQTDAQKEATISAYVAANSTYASEYTLEREQAYFETKIATITQAPAAQLARVLSAYAEKEAA